MSRLASAFKTSSSLETKGIVRDFGICRVTIARAGGANEKFNNIMARVYRENMRAIKGNVLSNSKSMSLLHEAYADAIILKWETFTGEDGEEKDPSKWVEGIEFDEGILPVTRENIVRIFVELPDLFLQLKETAEEAQFFRASLIEDIAKN